MPSLVSDTFARKSTLGTAGAAFPPGLGNPPYPECYTHMTGSKYADEDAIYYFETDPVNEPCTVEKLANDNWYYSANKDKFGIVHIEYKNEPRYGYSSFLLHVRYPS